MSDRVLDMTLGDVHALKRLAEQAIEEELAVMVEKANHLIEIDSLDLTPMYTADRGQVSFVVNIRIKLR